MRSAFCNCPTQSRNAIFSIKYVAELCAGCMLQVSAGNDICPFCRTLTAESRDEQLQRCTTRMEAGDADAFSSMGAWYMLRSHTLPQDIDKGLESLLRSAELESASAYYGIADFYSAGQLVPRNAKKALFHNQQAAMRANILARHRLGFGEMLLGNSDQAIKHWMIAVTSGNEDSLGTIKLMFTEGTATKAEYERALRAYHSYQEETQSDQHTRALEFMRAHPDLR